MDRLQKIGERAHIFLREFCFFIFYRFGPFFSSVGSLCPGKLFKDTNYVAISDKKSIIMGLIK